MSIPDKIKLNFHQNGTDHTIKLVKGKPSDHSVNINGINYAVLGSKDFLKTACDILNKLSIQDIKSMEELQGRLSLKNEKFQNVGSVGINILQTQSKKSQVLDQLKPSWPIIGQPLTVSITERMKALEIPGVRLSVIEKGKIAWTQGFGELEQPMYAQAASISKKITSLVIFSLIEEGKLTPDTDIRDILDKDLWSAITNHHEEPITLRELMAHTAGLEGESDTGFRGYSRDSDTEVKMTQDQIAQLERAYSRNPDDKILERIQQLKVAISRAKIGQLPTLDEILKGEGTNSPPVQVTEKPGTHFAYAGGGAMILQKVIESVTGQRYVEVAQERIFSPLDLTCTFSPAYEQTVRGYNSEGALSGDWMEQPELAAAGLWSTPEDLAEIELAFQKSLEFGGIVSQKSAQEIITPYFEKEITALKNEQKLLKKEDKKFVEIQKRLDELQEGDCPGLGVFIEKTPQATYFHHSGSNLGFRCLTVANDQGQGLVIMTNSESGIELIPEVIRRVAEVYQWKGSESFSRHLLPPLHPEVVREDRKGFQAEVYGSYQLVDDVVIKIFEKDQKVHFQSPNPDDSPLELYPVSEHLGFIKEGGRTVPVEFKDKNLIIHGDLFKKM